MAREQVTNAIVVLYSAYVAATVIPEFGRVLNGLVLPYFIVVPGYFVMLLLREKGTLLERLLYSVVWSLVVYASFASIISITGYRFLPLNIVIPTLTVALLAFDHYRRR